MLDYFTFRAWIKILTDAISIILKFINTSEGDR